MAPAPRAQSTDVEMAGGGLQSPLIGLVGGQALEASVGSLPRMVDRWASVHRGFSSSTPGYC